MYKKRKKINAKKKKEKNNRMGMTRDLFKKIRDIKGMVRKETVWTYQK